MLSRLSLRRLDAVACSEGPPTCPDARSTWWSSRRTAAPLRGLLPAREVDLVLPHADAGHLQPGERRRSAIPPPHGLPAVAIVAGAFEDLADLRDIAVLASRVRAGLTRRLMRLTACAAKRPSGERGLTVPPRPRENSCRDAGVTQLVECNLAKVDVAGSNPVSRSKPLKELWLS